MNELLLDVVRVVITGPTASGKSAVALELAKRLPDTEIVSVDSMKVYRDMNIGTAKPSSGARQIVRFHMLDVVSPGEEYNLGRYVKDARACLGELRGRARRAILVGGSMMYLRGLLEGVFEGPPADMELRRRLRDLAAQKGRAFLHDTLRRVDPVSAARLHPNDSKRVMRALEVYEKTGVPLSAQQRQWKKGWHPPCPVVSVQRPREDLCTRIGARVDHMIASGLVAEAKTLLKTYPQMGREVREAVGYREAFAYLGGQIDRGAMREAICRRTKQFARKQQTWLRNIEYATPLYVEKKLAPRAIAERLLRMIQRQSSRAAYAKSFRMN